MAWLASAAAALYLTGRSACQLTHDPGQRARYRSRGEVLGRRMGIALALVISVLFPPLAIVLTRVAVAAGQVRIAARAYALGWLAMSLAAT